MILALLPEKGHTSGSEIREKARRRGTDEVRDEGQGR